MVEYHRAFNAPAAFQRAIELFDLLEKHAHDSEYAGYWEVRRRDWSASEDCRLSEKDMNEAKSMNNHLHVLEACTSLYRIWGDPALAERLRELVHVFLQRILDSRTSHLHHFFDAAWNVHSDSYTFGHDIEASWLLCEAVEAVGDPALLRQTRLVALQLARAVLCEGLDTDGGLWYEGRNGRLLDHGKECWPQAEAIVGFLNAFQLSREPKYLEAAQRVWRFINEKLVDRVRGEWFWRIKPDGHPDPNLPKVSEWKGPYHATRACLETIQRLENIANV